MAAAICAPTRWRVVPTGTVVSTITSTPRLRCGAERVDRRVEQREVGPLRRVDVDRHDEHDDVGVGDGVARVGRSRADGRSTTRPGIVSSSPGSRRQRVALGVDLGDARGADVVAGDGRALRRELHRQRHADLAEADDA